MSLVNEKLRETSLRADSWKPSIAELIAAKTSQAAPYLKRAMH